MAWGANTDNTYEPSVGFDPQTWGNMGSEMRKRDYNKDVAKKREEAAGVYESKKLGAKRTAAYEKLQAAKKELEAMQAKRAQEESAKASEGMSGYTPAGSENPVQDMSEYREQQEPQYNRSYQEPGKTDVEQDLEEDAESPMLEPLDQDVQMFPKEQKEEEEAAYKPLEGAPVPKKGSMELGEEPLFSTLGEKTYGMPQPEMLDTDPEFVDQFRQKDPSQNDGETGFMARAMQPMVQAPAPQPRGTFDSDVPLFRNHPSITPNYAKSQKDKAPYAKQWHAPEQYLPLFPKRGR